MQVYAKSDVGRVRSSNQDHLYASGDPVGRLNNLFLVADGMGGHRGGDYASHFAVDHLVSYVEEAEAKSPVALFKEGISHVNARVYQKSIEDPEKSGMGTTLVAATIEDRTLYVANVGDSRLYLYHRSCLRQITRDHSYVEEMVARGKMTRNSKDYLEHRHKITRAVGAAGWVAIDFFEEQLSKGDLVLLCSDGLFNMMTERQMEDCLALPGTVQEKVERLIQGANEHGGRDNIAVVLIDPQISEVNPC